MLRRLLAKSNAAGLLSGGVVEKRPFMAAKKKRNGQLSALPKAGAQR